MARKYTLDDFFRVSTEVVLPNKKVIIVRTLSDGEVQARERFCTQALARKARELKDPNTDAYQEVIAPYLATDDKDSLLVSLLGLKRGEFASTRRDQTRPEIIIIPDDATPEEKAEALERREKALETWEQEVITGTQVDLAAYEKRTAAWDVSAVRKEVIASMIATQGRLAYLNELEARTLLYACYLDGKPFFKTREQVDMITTEVKQAIVSAYQDVFGVDPWALEDFFETET